MNILLRQRAWLKQLWYYDQSRSSFCALTWRHTMPHSKTLQGKQLASYYGNNYTQTTFAVKDNNIYKAGNSSLARLAAVRIVRRLKPVRGEIRSCEQTCSRNSRICSDLQKFSLVIRKKYFKIAKDFFCKTCIFRWNTVIPHPASHGATVSPDQ